MAYSLLAVAVSLAVVYLLLHLFLHFTQDKYEPPASLTTIPFITPLIRMVRDKDAFYTRVRDNFPQLPIYTLRLPFTKRLYIVNATELIAPIQKQWGPISFAAITAVTGHVVGASQEAYDLMYKDLMSDESYSVSWPKQIAPTISPGSPMLDEMNRIAAGILVERIKSIFNNAGSRTTAVRVNLAEWSRDMIISSTSDAVWGPQNPLRDPKVKEAWITFEAGWLKLQFAPLLWLLFPKLYRARETAAKAWIEYTKNRGYENASGLVRKFWEHHHDQFGLSEEDFGRGELGSAFAALSNVMLCTFWLLYHIFSDEKVLGDIRAELMNVVLREVIGENGEKVSLIDLTKLKEEHCPILLSTFHEVLRHRPTAGSTRVLQEDVMLDGKYLLKKGSLVMIPVSVQHTDTTVWGEDASQFDHLRFVRSKNPERKVPRANNPAFRSWGGGREMCPGRHYATTQILSLTALLVIQLDIIPVGGEWKAPESKYSPAHGFPLLKKDIPVELKVMDPLRIWQVMLPG